MKYLRKYESFDSFDERDLTKKEDYQEIQMEFNISPSDIGDILTDFIEEYDLRYKCVVKTNMKEGFYPKKELSIYFYTTTNRSSIENNIRHWVEQKIGHGHVWDWEILSVMDSRLSDHGLTIKKDDIYQIYLNDFKLELLIHNKDKSIPNSIKSSLWSKVRELDDEKKYG